MLQNKIHTENAFIWESSGTIGSQTTLYLTPLPDPTKTVSQFTPSLKTKRLKAFAAGSSATPKIVTKTSKEVFPTKSPSRPCQYRPEFRYYLQHVRVIALLDTHLLINISQAWSKAALNDSIFIILNCGRYERIGIRQSLSDVVSFWTDRSCQYPRSSLWEIAHMAIVQDVLERHELVVSFEKNTGTKRLADNTRIPPSKRRKGKDLDNTIPVSTDNQTEEYREVTTSH